MLDHLPPPGLASFELYEAKDNSGEWTPWFKPRGKGMFFFLVVNGGGGGGGGCSGPSQTTRGGGGGGGAGRAQALIIPELFVPNTLWLRPGRGGAGGTADNNGSSGERSIVGAIQAVSGRILNGVNTTNNGQRGTATSKGTGGGSGGPTAATSMSASYGGLLADDLTGDSVLLSGGSHLGAEGDSNTDPRHHTTNGAGGAGVGINFLEYAGGSILSGNWINGRVIGGAAGGGNGQNGVSYLQPFGALGGAGGGSSDAGVGGAGGNGGRGSGGGGGGAGVTGGRGGNGGNGYILIAAW